GDEAMVHVFRHLSRCERERVELRVIDVRLGEHLRLIVAAADGTGTRDHTQGAAGRSGGARHGRADARTIRTVAATRAAVGVTTASDARLPAIVVALSGAAAAFLAVMLLHISGGISEHEEMRVFMLTCLLVPVSGIVVSAVT